MPWEKKFDSDVVLDKAMHAFWAHGYEATSIQDLIDCMGINRGSIYAAFEDKRNLFLLALERYETHYRRTFLAELRNSQPPRGAITSLFDSVVETALGDEGRNGCLLVNTAIEMAAHDEGVAEVVSRGLEETQMFFQDMIEDGQQRGEIAGTIDARETAIALLGLLTGMRVLARSRPEREVLEPLAKRAKALLN